MLLAGIAVGIWTLTGAYTFRFLFLSALLVCIAVATESLASVRTRILVVSLILAELAFVAYLFEFNI